MSIINSDGKNTNWQFNVLKGLAENFGQLLKITSNTNALSQINPLAKRSFIRREFGTSGTIDEIVKSIEFQSVGTTPAVVNSVELKPTEKIQFEAKGLNNYFNSGEFTFDTSLPDSELLITYVV